MIETTGAVAEGPSGQMVVWAGGQRSPGEMLSLMSRSRSRSAGRPEPHWIRSSTRTIQVVPSRQGVHCPQDS